MRLAKNVGAVAKTFVSNVPLASEAAATNGAGVDRMASGSQVGYLSGILQVAIGAATGTPTSFTVDCKLQDSADNSSFADISSSVLATSAITQATAGSQVIELNFDASGLRRYIRSVVTVTITGGSSPTVPICTLITMGGAMVEEA